MAKAMWRIWRGVGSPAWRFGALTFAEVLLLWLLIVAKFAAFWRLKRAASWLLLPYLAWVPFASVLTFAIWQLHPDILR